MCRLPLTPLESEIFTQAVVAYVCSKGTCSGQKRHVVLREEGFSLLKLLFLSAAISPKILGVIFCLYLMYKVKPGRESEGNSVK